VLLLPFDVMPHILARFPYSHRLAMRRCIAQPPRMTSAKPSALLDTRVIYCGGG
jgi:hypothetical protein